MTTKELCQGRSQEGGGVKENDNRGREGLVVYDLTTSEPRPGRREESNVSEYSVKVGIEIYGRYTMIEGLM